ncbi:unnamed protein product [Rhodiola kirilowii]
MRNRRPQKGQKATAGKKKGERISNGDISDAENAAPLSSDSQAEPQHSDSEASATENKSVAEEEEEEDEEGAEEEEVEVVKKKTSAKKRKIEKEEEHDAKCLFPMNRIKMIAKSEGGDDMRLSHEAIFLLNKASEKFLELFCEEAYGETVNESKNYVAYHHLSSSVSKEPRFCFLSDLIPEKITAEEALKARELATSDPKVPTTN